MPLDAAQVVACVVTYNPGNELGLHLAALRAQVDTVFVIDNGSVHQERVADAARDAACHFIANGSNQGIAAALNQGIAAARSFGARWMASFDQDSLLAPGVLAGLLAVEAGHPGREAIGIVATAHRDRATGRDYYRACDILQDTPQWRELRSTITSGSLLRLAMVDEVGGFDESLFIDCVDHDMCLRARRAGWRVIESQSHLLTHSMGSIREGKLLGVAIVANNHVPWRRYYMVRNQLEVSRRYLWFDPLWSLKGLLVLGAMTLAIAALEERKADNFRAMLRGALDFAMRRFGARA